MKYILKKNYGETIRIHPAMLKEAGWNPGIEYALVTDMFGQRLKIFPCNHPSIADHILIRRSAIQEDERGEPLLEIHPAHHRLVDDIESATVDVGMVTITITPHEEE